MRVSSAFSRMHSACRAPLSRCCVEKKSRAKDILVHTGGARPAALLARLAPTK